MHGNRCLVSRIKDNIMKLTNNEQWVLDYLKGKDYVSPTEIGKIHALAVGSYSFTHHSAWASPICLRLVKKGLLLRNEKGQTSGGF